MISEVIEGDIRETFYSMSQYNITLVIDMPKNHSETSPSNGAVWDKSSNISTKEYKNTIFNSRLALC